jgi:hypothetical protein
MYQKLDSCGLVIANRKISETKGNRKMVSRLNRFIFGRVLLGFDYDTQSGLKLFRAEVTKRLSDKDASAWGIDVPLVDSALDLGYSVGEVEIKFGGRAPKPPGRRAGPAAKTATLLARADGIALAARTGQVKGGVSCRKLTVS